VLLLRNAIFLSGIGKFVALCCCQIATSHQQAPVLLYHCTH
jgi:hypothetical protein